MSPKIWYIANYSAAVRWGFVSDLVVYLNIFVLVSVRL